MTATQYSYDLNNEKRDLSDVLSTIIQQSPNFIRWFPKSKKDGFSRKHEWLEEWLRPKTIAFTGLSSSVFTVADSTKWSVGDYVHIKGDTAVLKVTATTDTSITCSFVAANGSDYASMSDITDTTGVLCYDSHPIGEASNDAPGSFDQSGVEFNTMQIFREDVKISGTDSATQVYGDENSVEHAVARTMYRIQTSINKALIFGTRNLRTGGSVDGLMGGLNFFGNQSGGLSVDANGLALDAKILNDAAMAVSDCGTYPSVILCSPIMCRVISAINHCQINISAQDNIRGSYVGQIVNDSTGQLMHVHAEPELNESDVWIIDPSGFSLVNMRGRGVHIFESTGPADDARRYTILGEMTATFKNAKQRLCRIKNLKDPRLSLEDASTYATKTYVVNDSITTVAAGEGGSGS